MTESASFLDGKVILHPGDCLDVMPALAANSIDACVCDPPYGLGFMGKAWDHGVPGVPYWKAVYRVLKPGAHIVAFGGTRTFGRMHVAIEDAGFEIRDMCLYLYGSGFPKSLNVAKSAGDEICSCKALSERDMRPVRNADVSAAVDTEDQRSEILLAELQEQDSSSPVLRSESTEGCPGVTQRGVEGWGDLPEAQGQLCEREVRSLPAGISNDGANRRLRDGTSLGDGDVDQETSPAGGVCAPSGSRAVKQSSDQSGIVAGQPQPQKRGAWDRCGGCGKPIVPAGLGTALKPACEPIVLARKPLIGTVAENVLKHGTGALNIDGCRVEAPEGLTSGGAPSGGNNPCFMSKDSDPRTERGNGHTAGRWPANVIHDGSDEVVGAFPDAPGQQARVSGNEPTANGFSGVVTFGGMKARVGSAEPRGDTGSAARFFYTAKADSDDRLGSKHPTVKPLDLMQWLVRLVTPKGGLVLDPFAGTGTTGEAAFREGMRAILIEREEEYQNDIRRRMKLCLSGPDERKRESIKARLKDKPEDNGPLFAGSETPPAGADRFTESSRTNHRADGTEVVTR